jgi:hypothetical protein
MAALPVGMYSYEASAASFSFPSVAISPNQEAAVRNADRASHLDREVQIVVQAHFDGLLEPVRYGEGQAAPASPSIEGQPGAHFNQAFVPAHREGQAPSPDDLENQPGAHPELEMIEAPPANNYGEGQAAHVVNREDPPNVDLHAAPAVARIRPSWDGRAIAETAVVGFISFGIIGTIATVVIWGPGAGLSVQGEKHGNHAMETAGHIMTFVGFGLAGAVAVVGCCGQAIYEYRRGR